MSFHNRIPRGVASFFRPASPNHVDEVFTECVYFIAAMQAVFCSSGQPSRGCLNFPNNLVFAASIMTRQANRPLAAEHSAAVLFGALSIYNELGGIQQFNRRLIDANAETVGRAIERLVVISLNDRDAPSDSAGITVIGCNGNRLAYVARFVRCLLTYRPSVILFAHVNLALLALLSRILRPSAATALFVHGVEAWGEGGTGVGGGMSDACSNPASIASSRWAISP